MDFKDGLYLTVAYKFTAGLIRLILGFLVLYFRDLHKLLFFIFGRELLHDPEDFLFNILTSHIKEVPREFLLFFAIFLISYSVIEIYFAVELAYRKRWAAIGMVVILAIGVLFDLFFVSRILVLSRVIGIIFDLIIAAFLIDMLAKHRLCV